MLIVKEQSGAQTAHLFFEGTWRGNSFLPVTFSHPVGKFVILYPSCGEKGGSCVSLLNSSASSRLGKSDCWPFEGRYCDRQIQAVIWDLSCTMSNYTFLFSLHICKVVMFLAPWFTWPDVIALPFLAPAYSDSIVVKQPLCVKKCEMKCEKKCFPSPYRAYILTRKIILEQL